MNITKPITIIGGSHFINAKGYTIIFNITADHVVLKDIKFENGNATGQYAYGVNKGGAIYWSGSNGNVTDDCHFTDNYAEYGGAIFVEHSAKSVTIKIIMNEKKIVIDAGHGGIG